jgi:hypothetical protein
MDLMGDVPREEIEALNGPSGGFTVTGYRLELSGYCAACLPAGSPAPVSA